MGFLTPFMLWGALAAGIPVAIHLFFRSRYRTVPWAAMKFLLTSVEQTSRRLKFQELLLLLLRMTVLAMLAFAFARPIESVVRGTGRGDSVDAVFVFDTSFSMGASEGPETRFAKAKDHAIKVIDELPAHSTVQIITCAGDNQTLVGPRSPANLDQARLLVNNLELTHLTTDLALGVTKAKEVLAYGQAANKELYVFSDMQQTGFEKRPGELKTALTDIKEKAVVHFVRCGTRPLKNVAIVGITPQTDMPRPGQRAGFGILVRNTGTETLDNLKVSLVVDNDEKNVETQEIPKLKPQETFAVTIHGMLEKAGLRVLTAKVSHDDLAGDNRYDQVILVRDQINILIVDGNYNEKEPEKASSYYLAHTLLPVTDVNVASYKYSLRVIPARLASPALLKNQDICFLVNCSLKSKLGARAEVLPGDFIEALDPFVRKGRGLVIFSGDNVQPEPYNKILGAKHNLLPMPLKPAIQSANKEPFFVNRGTFGNGPPAYWRFKTEKYYELFDAVAVYQHLEFDERAPAKLPMKKDDGDESETKVEEENPVQVIVKLDSGKPLAVSKKLDAGEVIFVATAANYEILDPKTSIPNWTSFHRLHVFLPFLEATVNHLMHTQTQTYNLVAGQTLNWHPTDKQDNVYNLIDPDGKIIRLGIPEKQGKRVVVTANDLPRAGIYRMTALPRGNESTEEAAAVEAAKTGTPIAVIPDLRESDDLTTLTNAQINTQLGFEPIHIIAGETESVSTGADRLNREWTVWALLAVLALVLFEVVLAWWCGKAW